MKKEDRRQVKTQYSLLSERINTILERDIAIFAALLLIFRLTQLTEYISVDALIAAAVVLICEILNAVRKAAEPTAFRSTQTGSEVYANTYDDSVDFEDIPDPQPVRRNKILDEINARQSASHNTPSRSFSADELRNMISKASSSVKKSGSSQNDSGKFIQFLIIALVLISFVFPLLMISDSDEDTYYEDSDYEYSDDSIYTSPFYTEEGFLSDKCDIGMEMLMSSDYDGIMSVGDGEGDAEDLLNMTDWSSASWTEDLRDVYDDDIYYAFIRYLVITDNGEYMVAFRFEGDDLPFDDTDAVMTGIAACPYSVWEEYDPEEDRDMFHEAVDNEMKYVGEVSYSDHNILTW